MNDVSPGSAIPPGTGPATGAPDAPSTPRRCSGCGCPARRAPSRPPRTARWTSLGEPTPPVGSRMMPRPPPGAVVPPAIAQPGERLQAALAADAGALLPLGPVLVADPPLRLRRVAAVRLFGP